MKRIASLLVVVAVAAEVPAQAPPVLEATVVASVGRARVAKGVKAAATAPRVEVELRWEAAEPALRPFTPIKPPTTTIGTRGTLAAPTSPLKTTVTTPTTTTVKPTTTAPTATAPTATVPTTTLKPPAIAPTLPPKLDAKSAELLRSRLRLGDPPLRFHVLRTEGTAPPVRLTAGAPVVPAATTVSAGKLLVGAFVDRTAVLGKTYQYRLEMIDRDAKVVAVSRDLTVQANDGAAPDAVPGVKAVPDVAKVALTWTRLNDPEVAGYRVYRRSLAPLAPVKSLTKPTAVVPGVAGPVSGSFLSKASFSSIGGFKPTIRAPLASWGDLLAELPPGATGHVDASAKEGIPYVYRVVAFDPWSGVGAGGEGIVASPLDTTAPAAPSNVKATPGTGGAVQVTWSPSPTADATTYRLLRRTGDEDTPVAVAIVPKGAAGAALAAADQLDPYLPYPIEYSVTAIDPAGNESAGAKGAPVRLPDIRPPAPPVVSAIEIGNLLVRLEWAAPTDDDVASWRVFRQAVGGAAAPTRLDNNALRSRTFEDRTGAVGTTYRYWVTAVDGKGNESAPSEAYEQKFVGVLPAPAPAGVAARADQGAALVTWTAPANAGVTGWVVFRADGVQAPFQPVSGVLSEAKFRDPDAKGAVAYRVLARYADGQVSAPSAPAALAGGGR
jgi:fibronectin type 3 domain-containing protein